MKIGMIIYSKTGNTNLVAKKIKEKFEAIGHNVSLEQLVTFQDEETDINKIKLENMPKVDDYDLLILGAPVRGFSLAPVMKAYLMRGSNLDEKKIGVYVTQYFPFKPMGGNQAITQFKVACEAKGGKVLKTGIINWSNAKREKQIEELVDQMTSLS